MVWTVSQLAEERNYVIIIKRLLLEFCVSRLAPRNAYKIELEPASHHTEIGICI